MTYEQCNIDIKEGINNIMNKYTMLQKLVSDKILVPEMIYIDESEFEFYDKNKEVTEVTKKKIECFIREIVEANHLPLVSIRCESKVNVLYEERAPISIVNVGIRYLKYFSGNYSNYDFEQLYECYLDRAKHYGMDKEEKIFDSTSEEIIYSVMCVYKRMLITGYRGDKGIIIQRMVMGNYDEKSGTGICCNYPGTVTKESYCKGIFIPRMVGIPSIKGCWGIGEMNLDEFQDINPKAYKIVVEIFRFLEKKYGPNPYIEFTCEGEQVYILQYEIRQRLVKKTEQGSKCC